MTPIPLSRRQANKFIADTHRHHGPVAGFKFAVGLADFSLNLRAAAVAGRPVSRHLDDGFTLEITRLCTNGTKNDCSNLYGRIVRIAREMGYRRVITYTLPTESGVSLRAAGWTCTGFSVGGTWDRKSRPRTDKHPTVHKLRWERVLS